MVLEFEFESAAAQQEGARPRQQLLKQHYHDPIVVSAHSIIDNTLAQVCSRKRGLSTPSLSNCSTTRTRDASSSSPVLKMSKSDSTIMDKLLRMRTSSNNIAASTLSSSAPNRRHHHHHLNADRSSNVVTIVSDGFPSSLSMESSSSSTTATSSSSNEQFVVAENNKIQQQLQLPYHDHDRTMIMMCPDTLIKSILFNYCTSRDAIRSNDDDNDDQPEAVVDAAADESRTNLARGQQPPPSRDPRESTPLRRMPSLLRPLRETEFLHPTEEQIAAYNARIIAAVRAGDIPALRAMHNSGQTLGCCNRYGESILHMACRRSNAIVVSFLLKEANVSPRIRDDHGRTPLHDACWRGAPEFGIVKLLLSVEPRLALAKDVWGHTAFQYAKKEHWGLWNEFLDQNRDIILS